MQRERVEGISKAQVALVTKLKDCVTCPQCKAVFCPAARIREGASIQELTKICSGFDEIGRQYIESDCILASEE